MSDDITLRRELQTLAHQAVTTRSQKARLSALISILLIVQGLIQAMTDAKVELSFKLDGEELAPQRTPDPRPTPPLMGGENIVVNDEGKYHEVPEEADNHQVPRAVLSAMHMLQDLVNRHGLHMLTAVCGYSEKRGKWTGSVLTAHTPESLPYLVAGVRDSLRRDSAQAQAGAGSEFALSGSEQNPDQGGEAQ
ncbi:hypothetical protein [Deinococcus kurensis]|uniref:hypothetical protein n=1 Tax=Deinococcus kurensis TaxID=2662757 RepID=UPI0012D35A62|nr:hypothetical protein [Deinococcus kurensis]